MRVWFGVLLLLGIVSGGVGAAAAEDVVSVRSSHSFTATLERVESEARQKGFMVFARLDHSAAAASAGRSLPPTTVVVIGNPNVGTERFVRFSTLAIDLPLKVLVSQDASGAVSVTYNKASHMRALSRRHGAPDGEAQQEQAARTEALMASIAEAATR